MRVVVCSRFRRTDRTYFLKRYRERRLVLLSPDLGAAATMSWFARILFLLSVDCGACVMSIYVTFVFEFENFLRGRTGYYGHQWLLEGVTECKRSRLRAPYRSPHDSSYWWADLGSYILLLYTLEELWYFICFRVLGRVVIHFADILEYLSVKVSNFNT